MGLGGNLKTRRWAGWMSGAPQYREILPEGWTSHVDPQDGAKFYHNKATQESLWEPPPGTKMVDDAADEHIRSGERRRERGGERGGPPARGGGYGGDSWGDDRGGRQDRGPAAGYGDNGGGSAHYGDNGRRSSAEQPWPVKADNLAWKTSSAALKDYFATVGRVLHAEVMMRPDGKSEGWGIVEFETREMAEAAIRQLHETQLDGRRITVRPADRRPAPSGRPDPRYGGNGVELRGEPRSRSRSPMHPSAGPDGGSDPVVHLRGMPWKATPREIIEFFGDLRVAPNGVHIVLNAEGRPSGDGFVEFETYADAVQALQKHKKYLGPRFVEVYKTSLREMHAKLEPPGGRGGPPMGRDFGGRPRSPDRGGDFGGRGGGFRDGPPPRGDFDRGPPPGWDRGPPPGYDRRGPPMDRDFDDRDDRKRFRGPGEAPPGDRGGFRR